MYRYFLFSAFVILYVISAHAFDNHNIGGLNGVTSVASFPVVYGWFHDDKSDKWITKDDEIKNIDNFKDYYIVSFEDDGKKYVAIIKEWKDKKIITFDTYIIDYQLYKSHITLWDEHTLIKFPILKFHHSTIKKGETVTKETFGFMNLSNLLLSSTNYFVLQYKFYQDDTVKFLFYLEKCKQKKSCVILGLQTKKGYEELHNNIGNDKLYSSFFYKTTQKYFVDFIDSPFVLNE